MSKGSAKAQPQISMDEIIITDKALEDVLEAREDLKEYVKSYRKADKDAKTMIQSMDVGFPFRVGRFVMNKTETQAREVMFETQPGSRITIKVDKENSKSNSVDELQPVDHNFTEKLGEPALDEALSESEKARILENT